jgi:hypothetical protein
MRSYVPLFKNFTRAGSTRDSAENFTFSYGRVLDIILDETHEKYEEQGGLAAINGVFYDPIEDTFDKSQEQVTRFAYADNSLITVLPEIGEIVQLQVKPASNLGFFDTLDRTYYTGTVNIWNHPKDNRLLDVRKPFTINEPLQSQLTEDYVPNKVRAYQGDVIIGGRQGQSLRFTNRIVDTAENSPLPVAVFRLGQSKIDPVPFKTVKEDASRDYSTIYITSDHLVDLKSVRTFNKGYQGTPAVAFDKYKGEQILISTGRFAVNAKSDDILLSSNKSLGVSTETVNIEAVNYIALTADTAIYLGEKALKSKLPEPLLKGASTVDLLDRLLNVLINIARDMATAASADSSPIPKLNLRGSVSLPVLQSIRTQLESLKSKKVFTE